MAVCGVPQKVDTDQPWSQRRAISRERPDEPCKQSLVDARQGEAGLLYAWREVVVQSGDAQMLCDQEGRMGPETRGGRQKLGRLKDGYEAWRAIVPGARCKTAAKKRDQTAVATKASKKSVFLLEMFA